MGLRQYLGIALAVAVGVVAAVLIGAKLARPDRQVCVLLGDGAFGLSGMEFDTFARHGVPVVGVIGNNGIWALEHHPMKFLYGYSVAAELRPALERAFASGKPALVNVLTDPEVVYPRKSVLA